MRVEGRFYGAVCPSGLGKSVWVQEIVRVGQAQGARPSVPTGKRWVPDRQLRAIPDMPSQQTPRALERWDGKYPNSWPSPTRRMLRAPPPLIDAARPLLPSPRPHGAWRKYHLAPSCDSSPSSISYPDSGPGSSQAPRKRRRASRKRQPYGDPEWSEGKGDPGSVIAAQGRGQGVGAGGVARTMRGAAAPPSAPIGCGASAPRRSHACIPYPSRGRCWPIHARGVP
mmetsp:Transcript_100536/g.173636  ORF Transcript_100536/g.173636 Transcript_100536/m.173636 type:complete len:226 (+) Transcript_100536:2426-3103(+)